MLIELVIAKAATKIRGPKTNPPPGAAAPAYRLGARRGRGDRTAGCRAARADCGGRGGGRSQRFSAVAPFLDERGRRLVAAAEAFAAGYGSLLREIPKRSGLPAARTLETLGISVSRGGLEVRLNGGSPAGDDEDDGEENTAVKPHGAPPCQVFLRELYSRPRGIVRGNCQRRAGAASSGGASIQVAARSGVIYAIETMGTGDKLVHGYRSW